MTDREVQAITQFLQKIGYLGCYHVTQCRRTRRAMSDDEMAQAVLDVRAAWRQEGLDVERLYTMAVLAHHYRTDQPACLPGCCGPWGEIEPVMPPGPGGALTLNQFHDAKMRAIRVPPPSELGRTARSTLLGPGSEAND